MKSQNNWFKELALLGCLAALLYLAFYFAVSLLSVEVSTAGTQWVNDSIITRVNVTNYAPRVIDVLVDDINSSPVHEIDLVSGTTRKVWCNGTVVDWNGKDDIVAVNATLYFIANKSSTPDDKNEHYSNRSCTAYKTGLYNKTYSCTFAVWFFANNGTWFCNMSAWDNGTADLRNGISYNSSVNRTRINPLYGLDVPPIVDFGEVPLNAESPTRAVNVTNTGNMPLDLRLYGYGGNVRTENNLSMKCKIGNISVRNMRFDNTSAHTFSNMWNLSGQFANPIYMNFGVKQRKSETLDSINNTYWRIKIPQYAVKGKCNGTIVFNAVKDT
ncbi:MAG: hypothetical protein V1837_02705 [Candidatus Woesearchaeota archaeon]